jgi:hypothetical protein
MDFIVGLPLTACKFDPICVIVNRFTKFAHFIPVHTHFNVEKYAKIYIACILYLHGIPKMIASDKGSQFVARFWEQLHASLGTHLIHSLTYHPQTGGRIVIVNQILEDMLKACVIDHQGSWDKSLPLAEFLYNCSCLESLKMAPFEALYGQRCRTPLNRIEPGVKAIFGPNLIIEAEETIHLIQDNLKASKSCQESYANKRHRPLGLKVRSDVYLHVSPMKGVKRFGLKGKLEPRYIGPFSILERCGPMAYKLDLLQSFIGVHDIFHVSQLKKCLKAPSDMVLPEVTPLEADLSYREHPIKILDQKGCVTRQKTIKFYKMQWSNHSKEEVTWESEDFICSHQLGVLLHSIVCCTCFAVSFEPFSLRNLSSRFL